MVNLVLSWLLPTGVSTLVYMLQQFEYDAAKFSKWMLEYPNLFRARRRSKLVLTKRAQGMKLIAYGFYMLWMIGVLSLSFWVEPVYLLGLTLAIPATGMVLIALTILVQLIVVSPRQRAEIIRAKERLATMQATRIAVLGSYGKTSMKELLLTLLSEAKTIAATPGNKNVLISHARWVNNTLTGDEEVLIVEYGEAAPGDIASFAEFSKPTYAIVTGLAPAHLDYYPSLEAVANDFADIQTEVKPQNIWCSNTSELLTTRFPGAHLYDQKGAAGYTVSDVTVSFSGTKFSLQIGKSRLAISSGLVGRHHIGPIVAAISIAKQIGLSNKQIISGIAKTKSYEHRMQPRELHGAWVIDDAYNGNIEGMKAGLLLLAELPAKRRIYVTPGLVDQGDENERVHHDLGELIAQANPDQVVLMKNSATKYIQQGLERADYAGRISIESNPLEYYLNLDKHIAAGDVVMLQNDWPDAYK